jgi:hypothetical protein
MRRFWAIVAVLMLASCQLSRPGGNADADAPNPVTGDPIEVSSLDAPAEGAVEGEAAEGEAAEGEAVAEVAEEPDAAAAEEAVAAEPVVEVAPPVDPALQTPEALACIDDGGQYRTVRNDISRACVRPMRDGGERCTSGRDCDGECLARSGTCAPVTPLFGCNDVLQDDGQRVTLCLN